MKRTLAASLLLLSAASPLGADAATDAARAELSRERRRLSSEASRLSEVSRRLEAALQDLAEASRAVADGGSRADVGTDELVRREDAVAAIEQEVKTLLERRRLMADRLVERRRTIALLEAEIGGKSKVRDVVSGRWTVLVEPGEQKGVFRMNLDGTLVSGEYTLEGGYHGSLRGTLVNDRLRLERVDSRLGFSAVYFGRLNRDGGTIAGTWEATTFGTGSPGAGRWRAVREKEREEEATP
ncbi:MAG: hypothetical protein ABR576_02485 [Thermoanaerobaculia bacterium]